MFLFFSLANGAVAQVNRQREKALIDSLNNKAFPELEAKDINKAEVVAKDALERSIKINYQKGEADAYLKLGVVEIRRGNKTSTINFLHKAIKLYEQQGAIRNENYGLAFVIISGSFEQEGEFLKCMEYARHALTIAIELKNKYLIALSNRMIAQAYRGMNQYDSSYLYFYKALDTFTELNNLKHIGAIYGNLGINYYHQKDYNKAIEYTRKNYEISRKLNNESDYAISFGNLAEYYYLMKAYKKSMECLDSAQYYGQKFSQIDGLRLTYQEKGKVYTKLGEIDSVKKYLELAIALRDSVYREDYRREFTKARAQLALHKQESENKLLAKDKDIALLQRNLAIAAIASTIALFGLILVKLRFRMQAKVKQQLEHQVKTRTEEVVQQKEEIEKVAYSLQLANDAINQKNKELSALNETKNRLLSVVSHDLKAPLNTLRGAMDALGDGYISEQEFKELSRTIRTQLKETTNLLDNLLLWARSQFYGKGSSSCGKVDLKSVIQKNSNLFHQDLINKSISFIDRSAQLEIIANEDEIDTVVRNLLANAIKFTLPSGQILIDTDISGNDAVLKISDTGVGMTENQIQKLFSQQTISTPGTNAEKGTGLGLFLCKELIEKNGGSIGVISSCNVGTTFYVRVPINTSIHS